jgi:hypothetical protein
MRKYLLRSRSIIVFPSIGAPRGQNISRARLARGRPPHPVTHRVRSAISMLAC